MPVLGVKPSANENQKNAFDVKCDDPYPHPTPPHPPIPTTQPHENADMPCVLHTAYHVNLNRLQIQNMHFDVYREEKHFSIKLMINITHFIFSVLIVFPYLSVRCLTFPSSLSFIPFLWYVF